MRTTIELDDDTSRAVARLRQEGRGVSEAVNELIRRGLAATPTSRPFVPKTSDLGVRIDVSDVAAALETLEGPAAPS